MPSLQVAQSVVRSGLAVRPDRKRGRCQQSPAHCSAATHTQRESGDGFEISRRLLLAGVAAAGVSLNSQPAAAAELTLGPLGRVSAVGAGTWAWGNQFLWGYDPAKDQELRDTFDVLLRGGVNFLDTADSYGTGQLEGRSEKLIGQFCAGNKDADKLIIGTKFAPYPTRLTPDAFVDAARDSIKRVGRKRIELGQLHWSVSNYAPPQEQALWEGMARCYEQGLIGAVGTSNYGPKQLRKIHAYLQKRGVPLVSNQVQYSLLSRVPETSGLVETCKELGVQFIGYSPLCLGILSGKYSREKLPEGPRGVLFNSLWDEVDPLLSLMRKISAERGVSVSQVAVAWSIGKGALPIPGVRTVRQAEEVVQLLTFRLGAGEIAELDAASGKIKKSTLQNILQTA